MIFNLYKSIYSILDSERKKQFIGLQILMVFSSLLEVISLSLIPLYLNYANNPELIESNSFLKEESIFRVLSFEGQTLFGYLSIGLIFLIVISTLISIYTVSKIASFAAKVGTQNGDRLYARYLGQGWLFHVTNNTSKLINNISTEAVRATDLVILPLLLLNSKIVLVTIVFIALLGYNFSITTISVLIFGLSYFFIYRKVKVLLSKNGKDLSELYQFRFKLMNEGFGSLKDLILLNKRSTYINKFNHSGEKIAVARSQNHVLWQAPKYFVELLVFGLLILFVYLTKVSTSFENENFMGTLSVYALAAFKILPAIQQIYASIGQIRGNSNAFENILEDLTLESENEEITETPSNELIQEFKMFGLTLENISFKYPGTDNFALQNVSINLKSSSKIGIVGTSGSGKSTLLNIILGLLKPTSGRILIGDKILDEKDYRLFRSSIGFVPQEIFLTDESIKSNIALGEPSIKINKEDVLSAINRAQLDDLIKNLPDGINSCVGERGGQLSGGQRQRIGIARALYHKPEILVFDEATSALDQKSEKQVLLALESLQSSLNTTIMVTHKMDSVKNCDIIFYLDSGKLIDSGTFNYLKSTNTGFSDLTSEL